MILSATSITVPNKNACKFKPIITFFTDLTDVMSLPALYETNPSITETIRLHVSTQRQKEVHVELLLNEQEGPNNAE